MYIHMFSGKSFCFLIVLMRAGHHHLLSGLGRGRIFPPDNQLKPEPVSLKHIARRLDPAFVLPGGQGVRCL